MSSIIIKRERKNWFYSYNMIFEQDLSEHAKIIYLFLCRCADSKGQSFPGKKTIGAKCGIKSRTTVGNALKDLKAIGLLEYYPRYKENGAQTTNLYILYDAPYSVDEHPPVQQMDTPYSADGHPPVQQMDTPCSADEHEVLPNEVLPNYNNNVQKKTSKKPKRNTKQKKSNVVVNEKIITNLKKEIDKVTGGKITKKQVSLLLQKKGENQIKNYIKEFEKLKKAQPNIRNPIGFLIRAIEEEWDLSVNAKNPNSFNEFEQHSYSEYELENLFESF